MDRLTARDLSVGHAGEAILSGLTVNLPRGHLLCILGPNGVGKTTLFRTLLGLIPPIAGQVTYGDQSIGRMERAAFARAVAHVPQSLNTPFAFTAGDLVLMGAAAGLPALSRPGRIHRKRARQAMEALEISHLASWDIFRLSGGQRQMVLIARALAQDTPFIIMDEPTASLDFANRARVEAMISQLSARGIGILLTTHDPAQAAELADSVMLLGSNGVVATGEPITTMTSEHLRSIYGIEVDVQTTQNGQLLFRAGMSQSMLNIEPHSLKLICSASIGTSATSRKAD